MPIKEIMTFALVIMSGWFLTGGKDGMVKNIRKTQFQILREVARTDNWGSPSIFQKKQRLWK